MPRLISVLKITNFDVVDKTKQRISLLTVITGGPEDFAHRVIVDARIAA